MTKLEDRAIKIVFQAELALACAIAMNLPAADTTHINAFTAAEKAVGWRVTHGTMAA